MAPEQLNPETKIDGRADIYAFGLLLREIFPHRYRHIAAKCSRQDRERRYSSIDAIQKTFRNRVFKIRSALAIIIIGLFVSILLMKPKKVVYTESNGYSDEFTELLGRAEHIIDSMYNPVLADLENDKSSQEVSFDFVERVKICRSLLQDIQSPLLDDPKTHDEFISAWERIHADKYNTVCFRLSDRVNEEYGSMQLNMNQ